MSAPRRTGIAGGLLALAIVYQFTLMPILWNESGSIPPIVWTSLSLALMISAVVLNDVHRLPWTGITPWVAAFLVGYPAACTLSFLLDEGGDPARFPMLWQNVVLMGLAGVFYAFGMAVARRASTGAIALAVAATAAYVFVARDSLTLDELYVRYEEEGRSFPYQYIGDAFAVSAMLLAPRLRFGPRTVALCVAAIAVMFMIPSRSSALFGATALLLWLFAAAPASWKAGLAGLAFLATLAVHGAALESIFTGTRFESIFTGSDDTSAAARREFMQHGLKTIARYPFTGRWASEIDAFGYSGTYIHNALDVWAQGGVLPMLLLLALWLRTLACWLALRRRDPDAALRTLPLLLFALLSWLFARNVGNAILFLGFGYFEATRSAAAASRTLVSGRPDPAGLRPRTMQARRISRKYPT